jgi:hypothetical protein
LKEDTDLPPYVHAARRADHLDARKGQYLAVDGAEFGDPQVHAPDDVREITKEGEDVIPSPDYLVIREVGRGVVLGILGPVALHLLRAASVPSVQHAPHDLDVLLRHRQPSISLPARLAYAPATRSCPSREQQHGARLTHALGVAVARHPVPQEPVAVREAPGALMSGGMGRP